MTTPSVSRRSLLGGAVVGGAALGFGSSFWKTALAAPATTGVGPYGAMLAPDANGLMLPAGFISRVVARTGEAVAGTTYVWPTAPDGTATFPTSDGGWIQTVNAEAYQFTGAGVSAIRYSSTGAIVDAYRILANTNGNCSGGPTPWGTWLSCEEYDLVLQTTAPFPGGPFGPGAAGQVWECDPLGLAPAVARPALGRFSHEAAAVDPATNFVYLTEDQGDGYLYRFRPTTPNVGGRADLTNGVLEAAVLADPANVLTTPTSVTWIAIPDPGATTQLRKQVTATTFKRGEGAFLDSGVLYFTTTSDDRVWALNTVTQMIEVVYDLATTVDPPLEDPDNITVHHLSGDLFVAEDDGNLEMVVITAPDATGHRTAASFMRLTGQSGTEVSGAAFDPSGTRLYFSSQRGLDADRGITYEVTGPFRNTVAPPTDIPEAGVAIALPITAAAIAAGVIALRNRGATATEVATA